MWTGGPAARREALRQVRKRRLDEVPPVSDQFSAEERVARLREIRRWYWSEVWNSLFCLYSHTGGRGIRKVK